MASDTANTLESIRALRAGGYSPKQIARALHLRPAVVAPLVRKLAAEEAAAAPEPALIGCWVSPGWSKNLTSDGHRDWPDLPVPEDGPGGIACVAVASGIGHSGHATLRIISSLTNRATTRAAPRWIIIVSRSRVVVGKPPVIDQNRPVGGVAERGVHELGQREHRGAR